jgi:hypothetical protein
LAAFPTIIFPIWRLTPAATANTGRAAIHPANKIDNSIVNNIEGSYHPQKCGIVFYETRETQTAKAAATREE